MLEAEDLVSYGTIGLMNALDRYDPLRGVRFEAFATSRIRGAVIDQLRALNWLPRSAVSRVKQVETTLATLEQRLGRQAKEDEAAKELGVTIERYRHMVVEAGLSMLSLDAPLSMFGQDDEIMTLRDLLVDQTTPEPSEMTEQKELLTMLHHSLEHLPEREQLLLSLYYVEELTMKEISRVMDVSESRVCQLHAQALVRLRTLFANADELSSKPKKLKATVPSVSKTANKARSGKVAS
jgi:RNA polymerase sigma factor for flagellar operon FliA